MIESPKGMSIMEAYQHYRNNRLYVNRRYQRKLVWTLEEKQKLIDTVLLKYPIPLFLFAEIESGNLEITVDAKQTNNRVVYTIRDTGKGIAQKHLEKIWDVFYRIDPRSSKTGDGIGLSLIKRIAEKHKGKVWVESEENKGTIFYIELHNRTFTEF